jgi:general stress protein YciG
MATMSDMGLKSRRGFAAMDPSQQRAIASKGGKAAHAVGRAHQFTPEEARSAGRKGGETVSRDRTHMVEIGRAGGRARSVNRAARGEPSETSEEARSEQS